MSTNDSTYTIWRDDDERDSASSGLDGGIVADSGVNSNSDDIIDTTASNARADTISTGAVSPSSSYYHPPSSSLPAAVSDSHPNSSQGAVRSVTTVVSDSQFQSSTTRVELIDLHSSPSPPFNDPVRMTSIVNPSVPISASASSYVAVDSPSLSGAVAESVSTYSLPYNRTAAYLLARHRGVLTPPHLRAAREIEESSSSSSVLPVERRLALTNRVMQELDQEEARAQELTGTAYTNAGFHATTTTVPQTSFSGSFASIAAEAASLHSSPEPPPLLFRPGASALNANTGIDTTFRKSPTDLNDKPLSASILSASISTFPSAASASSQQQPWSRALGSPIHTTGLNAEYFRSKLADRVAIGSPESVIQDSFQYQYAQQLADPHLKMAKSSAKLAAAIAAPHASHDNNVHSQVAVNPSASPVNSITAASSPSPPAASASSSPVAAATSISSLRAQLRQLASSPTFSRRQDEPAKLMPQLSPTAADAGMTSTQTPFDASLSRFAVSGSKGLTLAQLISSPTPTASPLTSASAFTDTRNMPETTPSAVRHHLNGFSHNLEEFREDLLLQRQQFDQDRAEAMAMLEDGNQTLEDSMTLESRNRDVSIESMKKYTETLIEAWNLAHADVWNAEIQRLESAADDFERKINEFDNSQLLWDQERTSQFRHVDDEVVRTLSGLSSSFDSMRAEHETESNHRALLKLRSLESKMQHLVERHGREQVQLQAELDAAMQQLVEQRVKLSVSNATTT